MAKGVDQERQLLQEGVRNINPTDKYVIDNFDDVAGGPKYYGYLGKGGTWYIMRETITGSVSKFEFSTGAATSQNIPAYLIHKLLVEVLYQPLLTLLTLILLSYDLLHLDEALYMLFQRLNHS